MSKIFKNNTASPVDIDDMGLTVPASGQLTVNPTDYDLLSASVDAITLINDAGPTLTYNDGTSDLSVSDAIDHMRQVFRSSFKIKGDSDDTLIGNVGSSLKVIGPDQQDIVESLHTKIHQGKAFFYTKNLFMAVNEEEDAYIEIANSDKTAHLYWEVASVSPVQVLIYENPTITKGSAITLTNNNRNYSDTPEDVSVGEITTVTSVGTKIYDEEFVSAKDETIKGGFSNEIVLKKNEQYIFRIKSLLKDNPVFAKVGFYESTAGVP